VSSPVESAIPQESGDALTDTAIEEHEAWKAAGTTPYAIVIAKLPEEMFGVSPWQLTTRCADCEGHPPAGFACLTCGARG
jgi:hypothetical protein